MRSTKMRTRTQMSIVSPTHGISLEILALEYKYARTQVRERLDLALSEVGIERKFSVSSMSIPAPLVCVTLSFGMSLKRSQTISNDNRSRYKTTSSFWTT